MRSRPFSDLEAEEMKRRFQLRSHLRIVFLAASIAITMSEASLAQCRHPLSRTWLQLRNREGFTHVLWFGFDSTATYGIDPHLCEFDLPPIPPTCPWWNPAFQNIPGREGWDPPQGLGLGTWYDYRRYVAATQVDTYRVFFGSADSLCNSGHPTLIRWSRISLAALCDSALIIDEFGGIVHRSRMDMTDSIMISHPDIRSLLLIRYGAFGPTSCFMPATRASIIVRDAGQGCDTLWFGFGPTATCGIDPDLCEVEIPVFPVPGIFDARWIGSCTGMSSLRDFRPFQHSAHVDTYRVQFLPGYAGLPMMLRWTPEDVQAICDSAIIQDEFGGNFFRVRMQTDSFLTVSNPAFSTARIIQYGQHGITSAATGELIPGETRLLQNHPNPFNSTTRVGFSVGGREYVTIEVFNMLGKVVATLVSESLDSGDYFVDWNATGFPGGVYFCRMQAGPFVETAKLLLLK